MLMKQSGPGIHPPPKWISTAGLITLTISVYSILLGPAIKSLGKRLFILFKLFFNFVVMKISSFLFI